MNPSLWDKAAPRNHNFAIIGSAAIAAAAIVVGLTVPRIDSIGSPTSHVAGEIISAILSAIVGITLVNISRSTEQRWFRLLGWGLLVTAGLDVLHGLTGSTAVIDLLGSSALSDWISLLSRVALAGFVICAVLTLEQTAETKRTFAQLKWPVAIAAGLVAGSVLITVFPPAGSTGFAPEIQLSFIPGIGFLAAFITIQRRYSTAHYTLAAFMLFLVANAAADAVFMSHSGQYLDSYFSGLHIFKLFAIGALLVGLLADSQRLYQFEVRARHELGIVNDSLNESNLGLTSASNDLRALNQIGQIAGVSRSVADRFDEIAEVMRSRIEFHRIAIGVVDEVRGSCTIEAVYGAPMVGRSVGSVVNLDGTHYGDVVRLRTTIVLDDSNVETAARKIPRLKVDIASGIRSWLTTPIIAEGEVVGIVLARSLKPNAYGMREMQFVEQVASQLAGPLRHGRGRRMKAA